MKSLAIQNVPDEVYEQIKEAAARRGLSVEQEAFEILRQWVAEEQREAVILAEARKNKEELASKGVFANDADLKAAVDWGRE